MWNLCLKTNLLFFALGIGAALPGFAQYAPNRYALILEDPPVSAKFAGKGNMRSAAARSYQQQIESKQKTLRTELASRKIRVTGSASTLMNAVFVIAPKERVSELRGLPGVKDVVPMRRYHQNLNRALPLINGPAAWVALNGVENAGAGMKIAILDSGIDQTHPAFQDPALPMPAGYPICSGGDCTFTNNKVIVARSYVRQLAIGSSVNPPDSRPDDYSARDRDGHGTAVASCAAGDTNTGTVTITGVAPKAYLGNYKIYGSPEVNDSTTTDVIIQAAEDAVNDGMDVISFSSGGPAFTGPLDSGAACGNSAGTPCDLVAAAFENAAKGGVVIVAAAGNDGFNGATTPTFNSIESPGDAPSVISAGATTDAHFFLEVVSVPGSSTLQNIATQSGDALIPLGALTAPLVDVTTRGDSDGLACAALPDGSLNGDIALILRGTCDFSEKLTNAENAGAVGVIFYMADQTPPIPPGGLSNSFTPAVMISNADGLALKNYAASTSTPLVTMDSNGIEETSSGFNLLAGFSSIGPSTGDSAVKPDLVAVGTTMYMAAQRYDSLGALYSSNGYAAADGTSFSTPLVAGAAALVKQSHPGFNTDQIRSALINTATQDVTQDDQGDPVDVQSLGGGKVDVFGAVSATVTAVPATVSFGILTAGSLPKTQQVQVTNNGGNAVTLAVAVAPNITATALPAVDKQSLTLAPGASGAITVTLAGTQPAAGAYSGAITLTGTGVALRIPYLYLVGDGIPSNIVPLTGSNFDGTVGQNIPDGIISFKLIDSAGVPIANAPVSWTSQGGGTLQSQDATTDQYGIAAAMPILGTAPGTYTFRGVAGGLTATFTGSARAVPTIFTGGVINAANADPAAPVAPGSYISIYGSDLSDVTDTYKTPILPLAIDYVNVSFDVPSANISVPGHLTFVSPGQVNVQVPWELQGQSAAQVKVTIDFSNGNVVPVQLANYAPAFFEASPGVVAALDYPNNQVVGTANPVMHGQPVQLFVNGLGPVSNTPASGEAALSSPLSETTTAPTVAIGGQTANVMFSGLAPGFASLYQVNVTVPSNLAPGTYPITISIGGLTSKASNISVQ